MKTKEESLKSLEKNYYSVQRKEDEVYDTTEKGKQAFDKNTKKEVTAQKKVQKECMSKDKAVKAKYKASALELKKNFDISKSDVEESRKEVKSQLKESLSFNKEEEKTGKAEIKEKITLANKEHDLTTTTMVSSYDRDAEELEKRVLVLEAKLKKDQASFTQKEKDLKDKHEQAVEKIQESEQTKINKLTEVSDKNCQKITDDIKTNSEKVGRRLQALKAVYEDELEEIDEKIETADIEFNEQYDEIKTSNEQRIAVREKHLQRAIDDKDKRSAKAHKKDIAKIRKEMEKDLLTLQKHHDQDHAVNVDYRFHFIKDNIEKWAQLEKEFIQEQEGKELDKKVLEADLQSHIKLTSLEFEKMHVEALQNYHKAYAETKEKEKSFELETKIELEKEALEKATQALRLQEEEAINKEVFKEQLEVLSKAEKDLALAKELADFKAKIEVDKRMAQLENDAIRAKLLYDVSKAQEAEDEKIEYHNIEFIRHEAYKDELLGFEVGVKELFTTRQEKMLEYEALEANNRFEQKIGYLNKQMTELGKDYAVMTAKAEEINKVDKAFYEKEIKKACATLQLEFDEFKASQEEIIKEKEENLLALSFKKDKTSKKEYKALDSELLAFKNDFESELVEKQEEIDSGVMTYKVALEHSNERLATALGEMEEFYRKELALLQESASECEAHKDQVLTSIKDRLEASRANMEDYQAKVQMRSENCHKHNKEYLDAQTLKHNTVKDHLQKDYESDLAKETERFTEVEAVIAKNEEDTLQDIANRQEEVHTRLHDYKQEVQETISHIQTETSNKIKTLESQHSKTVDSLKDTFNTEVKALQDELAEQMDQHKDHLTVIEKSVSEESSKLEQEKKTLKKSTDEKIKEDLSLIDNKVKEDIKNIK